MPGEVLKKSDSFKSFDVYLQMDEYLNNSFDNVCDKKKRL